MKFLFYCLLGLLSLSRGAMAQNRFSIKKTILVKTIEGKITPDGVMDEAAWKNAGYSSDYWQWFPTDSLLASRQTELWMCRDAKTLYIAAKCYTTHSDFVVTTLKRDFRAGGNDNISLIFDTFSDNTNGFLFGTNPFGVIREALISNGGNELSHFNTAWDNKWEGGAKIYDGYYLCEFAIPFSTLRYDDAVDKWNFNSYRFDTQTNENSTWTNIPQNQWIFGLSFLGEMVFEDLPPKNGANLVIIPYATGSIQRDFVNQKPTAVLGDVGGDAKIGITSGLNLDLTVNPDFSQVEVDELITNLTRFEISLPERRQFFTENSDLFGSFGNRNVIPFFSRRIGVGYDSIQQVTVQNPILGGARLSGKLSPNLRLGLLNMQSAKVEEYGLPSLNYTVGVLQQKLFSRSNVGVILANQQDFRLEKGHPEAYNRVLGVDYNLISKDNVWNGKAFYHHSFSPVQKSSPQAWGANMTYTRRTIKALVAVEQVGGGFDARLGFVPRTGYASIKPGVQRLYYPTRGILNIHGPGVEFTNLWTDGHGVSDQAITLFWEADFTNSARLRVALTQDYTYLFSPFDPSGTGVQPLPANTDYRYVSLEGFYVSDMRKPLQVFLMPKIGQFFNGYLYSISGMTTYRLQPYALVAVNFSLNKLDLPSPYAQSNLIQLGPRLDLTFNKKLFLTALFQYNNQTDNVNINTRLQWRFKPVSDVYLVYTDDYTSGFQAKNRALIAKLTYWLNI